LISERLPAPVALLLVAALACGSDPLRVLEKDRSTLAVVGRYAVTLGNLQDAFAYGLPGDTGGDAVRSRLWDALVEEVLVLNDVAPLPAPPSPAGLGPLADPGRRADAVRQVLEERVYSRVTVSDAEVDHYYTQNRSEFERGRGVLVRQMLLAGAAQAGEAKRLLTSGHSFLDVARLYSGTPDRGTPQYFEEGELPEFLRPLVDRLRPGVPSDPVEVAPGSFQVLLVERRLERYTLPLEEVAPLIRLKLTDAAQERLAKQYLASLRERFPVIVFAPKLPFRYEKESP